MLHSGSRALLVLLLVLLPAGARAALTLTSVALDVQVEGTNGTDTSSQVDVHGHRHGDRDSEGHASCRRAPRSTFPARGGDELHTDAEPATQTAFDQLFPTTARDFKIELTPGASGRRPRSPTRCRSRGRSSLRPPSAHRGPTDGRSHLLEVRFSACACVHRSRRRASCCRGRPRSRTPICPPARPAGCPRIRSRQQQFQRQGHAQDERRP